MAIERRMTSTSALFVDVQPPADNVSVDFGEGLWIIRIWSLIYFGQDWKQQHVDVGRRLVDDKATEQQTQR